MEEEIRIHAWTSIRTELLVNYNDGKAMKKKTNNNNNNNNNNKINYSHYFDFIELYLNKLHRSESIREF